MVKLQVPEGVTAVSHDAHEYVVEAEGYIMAEYDHVKALLERGFKVFVEELSPKEAKAKAAAEAKAPAEAKASA